MSKLKVRFACGLYDRVFPLYAGEVRPEGIDLEFVAIEGARQIFDRMAGGLEFEASELSASEFISRFSANQCPFVAIPAFPSRLFRHGYIVVNRRSGIEKPRDLEGKRVGVPLYTMTAAVWIRGLLQHDYGVDLASIRWLQGSLNSAGSHGDPAVLPMARPVPIEINDSGKSLSQLLDEGSIDAVAGTTLPRAMRRNPDLHRLFPNGREVEKDYYRRTGIFPIMHFVVVRRDLHEAHPFVAARLYKALCDSRELALERMRYSGSPRYMLPWMMYDIEEIDEVFGGDPFAYGVEPNRHVLETLVAYMAEQGVIASPIPVERLFVPADGGTSGDA